MSDTDEKLEITLPDDNEPENEDIVIENAGEKDHLEPEEGINDLKMKLENEVRRRFEAENRAREAIQRQYEAQNEREEANFTLVESAIKTVERDSELLRSSYREAMSIGDYDKVAEIQEAMTENKLRLNELNRGRDYMQSQRGEAQRRLPPQQQEADPVEALANTLSERSAAWIRSHPEYARDQKMFRKMLAAHELAISDGLEPDTDDYFESVETSLRIPRNSEAKQPQRIEAAPERQPPQKRQAPPAAPVSRSSGGPGTSRPNVVTLTRQEKEAAIDMGMSEQEYAKNKLLLQKEGRM